MDAIVTGSIRFLLNGDPVEAGPVDPTATLLDHLRYVLRRTGTKEGCGEGDCGACTVLVGEATDAGMVWRAVNACILFLPMLDGRAVTTVEGLGSEQHPGAVQRALVDRHATQCGFCTPGFVMSLEGRRIGALGTCKVPLGDVLAGNLCRCTGYGPILAAGRGLAPEARDDVATLRGLGAIARTEMLVLDHADPLTGAIRRWIAPRTVDELAEVCAAHPDARIVAGATDVGLWVNKQHRIPETIVWIGEVAALRAVREDAAGLTIGAGARYSEAADALTRLHPEFGGFLRRIGGLQVRNAGTIGGNIANGSPIGDMPPALIALAASVTLREGSRRRMLPLEDFFLSYGRQDRAPGEFVESLFVPRPDPATMIRLVKLSKRFDSDISAVCGAVALRSDAGRIVEARIAFGGMAGIPARARHAEAALVGRELEPGALAAAARALADDFTPLSDVRGSAAYRLRVAGAMLLALALATRDEADLPTLEPIDG